MKKSIVLGADDYGQAEAVSHGIIDLIQAGRITATSALVNAPDWPLHARWLLPHRAKALFGLHLNLTQGAPLSPVFQAAYGGTFPSLRHLLLRAYSGRLSPSLVQVEFMAQLEAFKSAMGFYPAYLDGHQHVHHFPGVRAGLQAMYESAGLKALGVRIRSVSRPLSWGSFIHDPKAALIQWTGASALENNWLKPQGILHNTSFEGIYSFSQSAGCRAHFQRFFAAIQDGGMIMCHPGRAGADAADPIHASRHHEYAYLLSDDFLQDIQAAGIILASSF